jgi:hypothetical protein
VQQTRTGGIGFFRLDVNTPVGGNIFRVCFGGSAAAEEAGKEAGMCVV